MKALFFPIALLLAGPIAHAAVLEIENGQLVGASGIEVAGDMYDVRFVEGTFVDVFGSAAGIDATSYAHAVELSQALGTQVFNQHLGPEYVDFDLYPNLTFGIFSNTAAILIPFAVVGTEARNVDFRNVMVDFYDQTSLNYRDILFDTTYSASTVYADWTKVSSVPIPAGGWLLMSGLIGLLGMRRHTNAQ